MSPTAVLESTEWPSFVCSSLAMLRQEGVLCDTTLLGKNGRTLLAHSCILAAASPVLRTIVTQQNLVSFLHKTDFISRGVWDVILEFIYRGKVTIETVTDAHDIMVAAEKLELEKLRSLCEDFLHIEGAILKEHVDPIVLDEEPQKELHIIKIEPNLSTDVEQNLESEIDTASYANVMPPGMVQSNKPEVSTSVRIKTEPIDDAFDKQSASNTTSGEGGGHESNHVGHGTGAINNQPLQTDATIYPFITPASPLVSSSRPVSQPVGRWSTAPMVTDLSRQIPVTIPVTTVPHKLPVILPDTVDATVINGNNITQRLPLTRALLSTSQTLTANNSAPQLSHIVVDTMLTTQMSSDNGPEEPPALVTVNHPYVSNSLVTNGCILDTCGQSGTYSSAVGVACLPVSSTVEDEGPLCLVMPKKKPPVKTRRKRRPVVVRPQVTSMSSPVNPPSFHSPKSSPVGIHLTPTTGTYPTSATGQYLPSVQQQPIPASGQQLTVVSSDLTPPPDPSNLCPTLSSYGEWRTSELKRRSANKRSKELGTITGLEAANVSPVGNTGQMSPSSIAQAEVPTAAVPLQVAAPSDGAAILEGRPVNDQQAKEQIAIEAITQLSGACSGAGAGDVMGRGRRKKTTAMKRRHPNHNGVLSSQKAPKLTIKLKTPKRQPSCSLTLGDTSQEIPESALNEDTGLQRCNVVMYDTTAVEPGATLSPPSENNPTCVPTTVLDASQLNTGSIVLKLHSARMSDERQLMRPWLEMQLTTSSIPGLHWLNPEKTLARIPWLHASRTSYQMDTDSCLFMLWAEHTGKYVPGRDEPDPKRWKANFRCALNSLADVLEVKDSSQKKGREAFKVYEFLPQTKKSRKQSTPHPNSGRKRREDTSSSGGEADTGKTGRRKQTFQSRSLSPINRATNKSPKMLTGREIMSVMRRKGGMINCDVLVDDTDNNVIPTAVSRMESHPTSDFTLHSHPTSDVILKPDSTSSMVPSSNLDSTRVISDAPPSVSPTDPCTQSVAADTSTHCTTETDLASPVHLQRTAGSTTPWTTGEQPKMKEEAESAAGMRMIHKGFSCRQCSQWFTHSTMLARHQLSHTGSMKAQKDTAGLGCTASAMSLAIGNQVVEQKPMQT